jgi:hypothetical protein
MKKVERVTEHEVISEFLRNEFYHEDFHRDRNKFEQIVLNPDLGDELENALRRALLFRRRGHMWRELPTDTQWWRVELEGEDLSRVRVFPRANWRKISNGSFWLSDVVRRIQCGQFSGRTADFISKIQGLSYALRRQQDTSSILLIGIDEKHAFTILEGNHRLAAAVLASPDLSKWKFRVLAGLSPHMHESCWYNTNVQTLWRYVRNRVHHLRDREADVRRATHNRPGQSPEGGENESVPAAAAHLMDSKLARN